MSEAGEAGGESGRSGGDPAAEAGGATLWHGRFEGGSAEALQALNDSLPFDRRMFREDIAGSRAHATMLGHVGLLTGDEVAAILDALGVVEAEIASGEMTFAVSDEDIHTAVERRVTELTPAGAKLHTGRSRNDQVATDLRLWTLAAIDEVSVLIRRLCQTLADRAAEADDAYLPGYTHLQRAQSVSLAHHLLAHGWTLLRDLDRLADARRRVDVSPLGAGALAGSSLALDPTLTAEQLGFSATFENSLDAVSDRDFVAETLFALSMVGIHLSRMGEEFVLWSSSEFGFVSLSDGFSTGSSMMPQKKNPDVAELARGKAGRLIGHLTGLLATLKGLPLTYNKDLQEDKEPLFDAVDTVRLTLLALDGMLAELTFNTEVMAAAADDPMAAATDLAEYLVTAGMPFRDAHAVVGAIVREALTAGAAAGQKMAELVTAHVDLGPEAAALLQPGASVVRRTSPGGGAPSAAAAQLIRFQEACSARK